MEWTPRIILSLVCMVMYFSELIFYKPEETKYFHKKQMPWRNKWGIYLGFTKHIFRCTVNTLLLISWDKDFYLSDKPLTILEIIGYFIAIFGISLRIYAKCILGKYFTYALTVQATHKMITHGPYSIVRHPGYAGMILYGIGNDIWSPNKLYIVLNIFTSWMLLKRISIEEAMLSDHLSKDNNYIQYKKKVPYKLFPFLY
eukprot:431736_1